MPETSLINAEEFSRLYLNATGAGQGLYYQTLLNFIQAFVNAQRSRGIRILRNTIFHHTRQICGQITPVQSGPVSVRTTALSMVFISSLTLPGHEYPAIICVAAEES